MKATVSILACFAALLVATAGLADDDEPPALNPFAPRSPQREDAQLGCVELSDGAIFPGRVFLTRDTRLRIYDQKLQRQREVPLRVVRSIECTIEKEWMEREWRFKENANDEKIYTGRQYPARQYRYQITLQDDRTISGTMSGIIYVSSYDDPQAKPERFLLHKRDKGPVGSKLESLVFLQKVELGEQAMRSGQLRKTQQSQAQTKKGRDSIPGDGR